MSARKGAPAVIRQRPHAILNPAKVRASQEAFPNVEELLNCYLTEYERNPYGLRFLFDNINALLDEGAWGRDLTPQSRHYLFAHAWRCVSNTIDDVARTNRRPPPPAFLVECAKNLVHKRRCSLKDAANRVRKVTGYPLTEWTLRRHVRVRKPL